MPSKKNNIMKENVSGYLENRLGYAKRIKTNQMLTLGSIYGHNLSLVWRYQYCVYAYRAYIYCYAIWQHNVKITIIKTIIKI